MPTRAEMLNPEQRDALTKMQAWIKSPSPFFLLKGSAGTGKTFVARAFSDTVKGRLVFTAPTNKATKVLRDSLTSEDFKPECRTIFSLLGLRLEANGEIKELSVPEDPIDLTHYAAVIVDEGSMVNATLMKHIHICAANTKVKFLFMGDAAQLPPVGEAKSAIWNIDDMAELATVMRYDNQILKLATALRKVVDHIAPTIKLTSDNEGAEGIWSMDSANFERAIIEEARQGGFSKPNFAKAIAWRNVRVEALNRTIRATIFREAWQTYWLPEDRVLFAQPAKNLDDEVIATTDDEGQIHRVIEDWHPTYAEFKILRLSIVLDDNRQVIARILHPDHVSAYDRKVEELLQAAKADRRKWRHFWDFKDAFHSVRHAYAITAHRAQGSTYEHAYVDWRDILLNRNRQEAYRCLYVACTRPKKVLVLG